MILDIKQYYELESTISSIIKTEQNKYSQDFD